MGIYDDYDDDDDWDDDDDEGHPEGDAQVCMNCGQTSMFLDNGVFCSEECEKEYRYATDGDEDDDEDWDGEDWDGEGWDDDDDDY